VIDLLFENSDLDDLTGVLVAIEFDESVMDGSNLAPIDTTGSFAAINAAFAQAHNLNFAEPRPMKDVMDDSDDEPASGNFQSAVMAASLFAMIGIMKFASSFGLSSAMLWNLLNTF
jgi:hypothetical protein